MSIIDLLDSMSRVLGPVVFHDDGKPTKFTELAI